MNIRKEISILLMLCGFLVFSQEITIEGHVVSKSDNVPLAGASVYVPSKSISSEGPSKGTVESVSIGVVTDFDGNFTLKVPSQTQQIAVSYIGFETQIITLYPSKKKYTIALEEAKTTLDEVVVTGYQKIEKRKLTSSVVKVEAKDIRQAAVASVDQLLQGQVAGMVASVETGAPGEISKIRIRGTASLSGAQDPLWVVDGLPLEGNDVPNLSDKGSIDELRSYSIAGINPDDIKDITILKDAAATAIYGARAANGVIVITTKKGEKGRMRVNFSVNTFMSERPDFSKLNLMSSKEKVDFELYMASRKDLTFRQQKGAVSRLLNEAGEYESYQNEGVSALSRSTLAAIEKLRNTNGNWSERLYRSTFNQQYSVSVSGGGEKSLYYASLGYYNEEGNTVGTGFKRYNFSVNNTFRLNDKFQLNTLVLFSQSDKSSYISDTDAFTNPSNYSRNVNPYYDPYQQNGEYRYDKDIEGYSDRYIPFNFLQERENTSYTLKNQSIKAILKTEYEILKGTKWISEFGVQMDKNTTHKFADENTYFSRKYREKSRYYNRNTKKYEYFLPLGGIVQDWNSNFNQYNWKNNLELSYNIDNLHEFDVLLGSEIRKNSSENLQSRGFGFNPKTLTTQGVVFNSSDNANKSEFLPYKRYEDENAYASFYATSSYTYAHRYTLFGSVRYDGSNLFGVDPKYRYQPLWSVSGSWLVSNESFWNSTEVFPYLRLRASYGLQGNIDKNTSPFVVGNYGTMSILPNSVQNTIVVTSPPNDKLRWEKTASYNFGFDLGLFSNRIRVAADVYKRISSDLIGIRSLPFENGFNSTTINWAQITNQGYEFTVSSKNIETDHFSWNTSLSFSHNQSNVDKMQVRDDSREPSREGLPVNAVFAFKSWGLDDRGLPMMLSKDGTPQNIETYFKLYDQFPDFPGYLVGSRLSANEIRERFTYVGDRDPKFSGGIVNTFTYQNFDLNITANFNIDQTMVRSLPYNPAQVDRGMNYSRDILSAWTPENPTQNVRIIGDQTLPFESWMAYRWLNGGDATYGVNTFSSLDTWVKHMSYLRITSIRLGYSLPEDFVRAYGIDTFRLSLEGRNLWVFSTDYTGYFDPETYGNIYAQPLAKSVTLGLNISF